VNITDLLPYTTYYYLPQYSNATTPYTFTTARSAGDPTPYTVGVVVDMVSIYLPNDILKSIPKRLIGYLWCSRFE
jgi:hypothetical protein